MSHKTLDNPGSMAYNLMPSKNQTAKPPEHESSTAADRIYNLSRTDEPENTPRTSTHTRNTETGSRAADQEGGGPYALNGRS